MRRPLWKEKEMDTTLASQVVANTMQLYKAKHINYLNGCSCSLVCSFEIPLFLFWIAENQKSALATKFNKTMKL